MREDIPATKKRKICIVGFADGHRDLAPWDDPDMEFWGLNRLHQVLGNRMSKFTRWFELHSLQKFYLDNNDTQHQSFLEEFPGPVYLRPNDMGLMDIPNGVPFPIESILAEFPDYFTNTVSWLMALAILMLADAAAEFQADPENVPAPELHIYGVDMAQDSLAVAEFSEQRPSCEFFLGHAAGMGIQLFMPEGSDLLKASHRYGFDSTDPIRGKHLARIEELNGRRAQLQAQLDKGDKDREGVVAGLNQLAGAVQDEEYWLKNLVTPAEEMPGVPDVSAPAVTNEVLAAGLVALQEQIAQMAPEPAEIGDTS